MKKSKIILIVILCLLPVSIIFLKAISILGPLTQPDFKKMKWKEMQITYWVLKSTEPNYRKNKRTFLVSGEKLAELKDRLSIKKTKSYSLGSDDQIVVTMDDGEIWQGDIVFEDRFDLCMQKDNYYSYIMELNNYEFYDYLIKLCVENEKIIHPNATKKNIMLRRNTNESRYLYIDKNPNKSLHRTAKPLCDFKIKEKK